MVPRSFSAKPVKGVLTLRRPPTLVTVVSFEGSSVKAPIKVKQTTALSNSAPPMSELLARPDSGAILDCHISGFSTNAAGLKDAPIRQLKIIALDTLTGESLEKIDADLKTPKP